MVEDGVFSHKIDYVNIFLRMTGSKVEAILLNGWILPIGGASALEGLRLTGLPRLVSGCKTNVKVIFF